RRADLRQIDPRPRAAFEDDSLLAVPIKNRVHGVVHGKDKAGRTLRPLFDAAIEPHWTVEAGFLMHQNMGQFVSERPGIFFGGKIAVLQSPAGYGINHPPDHLADAMFPLWTAQRSTEVLRDDHVGGHLRPGLRDFNVRLLEDNLAPFV